MTTLSIILQGSPSGIAGYLPLIVMFLIIYVFFILPARKKTKEQQGFAEGLSKGDEVVAQNGIIGQITRVTDSDVTIQTEGKTYIRMVKSAISKEMTDFYNKSKES